MRLQRQRSPAGVRFNVWLLSGLLLFGQAAIVVHSLEHPYLKDKATCTLCQFGQQDKSAVPCQVHLPEICKQEFLPVALALPALTSQHVSNYLSRAPPLVS